MKKILSIVICVLLGVSSMYSATNQLTIKGYAIGEGISEQGNKFGGGTIKLMGKSATGRNQNSSTYTESDPLSEASISVNEMSGRYLVVFTYEQKAKLKLEATAAQNYIFEGFTQENSLTPTNWLSQTSPYGDFDIPWQGQNGAVVSYYAVFKKIIKAKSELSFTKTAETETTTFDVGLYKADNFRVVSTDYQGSGEKDFTCTVQSTAEDKAVLSLAAGADVVDGDVFIITLETDNGGYAQVKVTIVTKITVRFERPQRGKGSYKAIQPNFGNAPTCELSNTSDPYKDVELNNTDKFMQQLTATPADGYSFYRWVITDAEGTTYSTSNPTNYKVQNGDKISVEFLPNGLAQFMVKDDPAQKLFYELDGENGVFAYAATLGKNVVVVHTSGTLYNEYKTPNAEEKYEFNIPAGYTLLVPGEANYMMLRGGLPEDGGLGGLISNTVKNYVGETSTATCYRELTLLANTRIIAYGDICVFSKMSYKQRYNGMPSGYGEIKMGIGTEIIMKSGSYLTCFGYISGDPTNSKVTAENGATIYEAFQMRDWRGGSAASGMNKNGQWVFPIGQYYVQNVETKLILEHGAEEYVTTIMMMSSMYFPMNIPFIMKDNGSKDDKGFLCLADGTQVVKWYDYTTDRQMYRIEGNQSEATAKFGKIVMDISVEVSSSDYVLPITNNIDVTLDNIQVTSLFDMALLADAKLHIEEDATLTVNGELFVYDKEQQHANYFYQGDEAKIIQPVLYTAHHDKTPGIRTDAAINDASIIVDGKLTVQESSEDLHGTGLYTTAMDANGTSTNPADYGANITSNGGGIVDFQVVGTQEFTYQYYQKETQYLSIPITNARLRNENGTYAAGDTMQVANKFLYSKPNTTVLGKWLIPTFVIPNAANSSNIFNITLPQPKTQNVVCNVTTAGVENISIANFTNITLQSGSRFAYTANSATYNKIDDEHGQLTIPLTYDAQKIHNVDAPYTEEITISYTYLHPIENVTKSESANITLTAIEDYTPKFKVAVNSVDVTEIKSHTFPTTHVGASSVAPVVITPDNSTVASLASTAWSAGATAEPTFTAQLGEGANKLTDAKVSYNPQMQSNADAGILTITATYTDATPRSIPYSIEINLSGDADKKVNTLAFREDLAATPIYQGQSINDIFKDLGNGTPISFTYEYADGTDASALVTVVKDGEKYKLIANEPNNPAITEIKTVIIKASQEENAEMVGTSEPRTLTLYVYPPVIWNWSNLYFGNTYDNPVVVSNTTTPWTLTKKTDANSLVTLSGNSPDYTATIGNGDANQVYQAIFTFKQGDYTKDLTSNIFADPRVLGYCVNYTRQFRGVSTPNTTVTFDEATRTATFNENNTWEINMIGIPDKLTFNASGDNMWYIGERASESTNYSDVVVWSKLSGEQTIQLKPTTSQVIIQYGAGDDNGTITNLCISELEISADKDAIYFPINKDGSESAKTIIFTHTESTAPTIDVDNKFNIETISMSGNLGSEDEPYYQTTIALRDGEAGDASRVTKGTYTLTATQGGKTISVTIHADEFPQGLPIKLATDDVKRYHFIAIEPDKVAWDATNREVVFQAPEGNQTIRSVTFAFEGAPSRISFNASQDIVDAEWTIYESLDGTNGSFVESGLVNRDTESGGAFTHNLKYTTRYVRLVYDSEIKSEVTLSDLVIEGDPMLLVNPDELEFSNDLKQQSLTLTAINLSNIRITLDNTTDFQMSHGGNIPTAEFTLSPHDYPNALGVNKVGDIVINTEWISTNLVNDGVITIYNTEDKDSVLAKVKLVGAGKYLRFEDAEETGVYTGIPDGTVDPNKKYTYHGSDYTDYTYHQVDLTKAFANDGTALFDYLFVFGETTTTDGTTDITAPNAEDEVGSNARTPYYVYVRDVDAYGNFDRYRFVTMVDNANEATKAHINGVTTTDSTTYINVPEDTPVRIYISGFCPYATTGADKFQEGVFFFRGYAGSQLDVYLEDAHIFARNKMQNGQPFYTRGDERNPTFTEGYARGSGGVLVFECMDRSEQIDFAVPFDVTIHTIGNNLLRSNYGCFNYFFGMDPYQISAPVHVRLHSSDHVRTSKTTLNFTDEWPTALNADRTVKASERTNGYLALRKPNDANNAPSIDLGNPYTVVNFKGGQVNLQNAQIVSTNYKTTLAISYRSGEYGGDKVGLKFAYGIGTDSIGGMVNFYDGTITIQPMWVKEEYKNYYLIDKDAEGNEIKRKVGTVQDKNDPTKTIDIYEYQTTCLRCPKNTYVYGGSICWLRACQHVTSKGGAPMGAGGTDVGQFIYDFKPEQGDEMNDKKLVTKLQFPNDNIINKAGKTVAAYFYDFYPNHQYGVNSITPDAKNKLYFWIPEGYGGVSAEKDKFLTTWKACMTEISAGMQGITGSVGGNTAVEKNEEIKYMLYCQIDQNISNVITAGEGEGDNKVYSYSAPVKVPGVAQAFYGSTYTQISPTSVGDELQNEVLSEKPYEVTDKVFYITTATADVWQTFTAPFDVAKIWVVETYSEAELKKIAKRAADNGENARDVVMLEQAEHNADFAAFFGVAMAIGTIDPLETIFNDFKAWGELQDKKDIDKHNNPRTPLYNGTGTYTLRDRYQLVPYIGSNWSEANFYLNHNVGDWILIGEEKYEPKWELLPDTAMDDGILLHQGETYSMLFPYCSNCFDENAERAFWDYWSGKFLIFESVDYSNNSDKVHILEGSNYLKDDWTDEELETLNPEGVFVSDIPTAGNAKVTGNSTFAFLETSRNDVYVYSPDPTEESFRINAVFDPNTQQYVPQSTIVLPTTAFLWANIPPKNMPARGIKRTGEIIYDDDNNGNQNGTSGHIPTVGGGNDLFITTIEEGINVAVAAPQHVRVLSSTGAVIYSGMIQTALDIPLPSVGVYVVSGENEVQKVLY